ncbi:MAG: hypothetical protein RSE00_02540 [Clostridia bacterium]
MVKFIMWRKHLKESSKQQQEILLLLKDRVKVELGTEIILISLITIPLSSLLAVFIEVEHTLINIVGFGAMAIGYCVFIIWLFKKFKEEIRIFVAMVEANLYYSMYLLKGNAISNEDIDIIKNNDKNLYGCLTSLNTSGYCYFVCFSILKCLKRGKIEFIAIKNDKGINEFTMHVLYVNNDWCFDTFSQKQYLVNDLKKIFQAKEYASFSYSDIENQSYEEFRNASCIALEKWCNENDCYQEYSTP